MNVTNMGNNHIFAKINRHSLMRIALLFFACILFGLSKAQVGCNPPAGSYKIGVVMFRHDLAGFDTISSILDSVVQEIGGGLPLRSSNNVKVQVVVQLEVPWKTTERVHGNYDFGWFQEFARLCEARSIKWTPLLSPHYLPTWLPSLYPNDSIEDPNHHRVPNPYMPLSPSSKAWRTEARSWAESFLEAMQNDNGQDHFGPTSAIDEVLIGNEMTYPNPAFGAIPTSYDSASHRAWDSLYSGPMPYSGTTFMNFRGAELALMLQNVVQFTQNELAALGHPEISVSTKVVPYLFPRSGWAPVDEMKGYTVAGVDSIQSACDFLAANSIPKPDSGGSCNNFWKVRNDYVAATSVTSKSIYITEYNVDPYCGITMPGQMVFDHILLGIDSFRVKYFTFFAWNPFDPDYRIQPDQIVALRNVIDCLVDPLTQIKEYNVLHGVMAYPIPASTILKVENEEFLEMQADLKLVNSLGQVVYASSGWLQPKEVISIDVNGVPQGMYLLRVSDGEKVRCIPIVVGGR